MDYSEVIRSIYTKNLGKEPLVEMIQKSTKETREFHALLLAKNSPDKRLLISMS
jgi:hypothetical protein